jgi:pyrroline-5-carboxylate reductase
MSYNLGFIGCGNMANAIIRGILDNKLMESNHIFILDSDPKKTENLKESEKVWICSDIKELQTASDIIFLCVKPNVIPTVLSQITQPGRAFISIAAGVRSEKIKKMIKVDARVLRIMPNTPLMVGVGAAGFEVPSTLKKEEFNFVKNIFQNMGKVVEVDASLMDAVTGISGSGPAYMYYFLNALVQAGIKQNLRAHDALTLALQTMKGAVEMVERLDKPLETLISEVCSPGGTTIEALAVFDNFGLNEIVDKAVDACTQKSAKLSE